MRATIPGIVSALLVILAMPVALSAEKEVGKEAWDCSIKVSGKHYEAQLVKMAKVSMADAEKTALAALDAKDADKKVKSRELEAERGCLIYSFEISLAGRKGIEEINIDARRREGPRTRARITQRFTRHVSPLTTTVYTHPSDEEMFQKVRGLRC